MSGQESAGAAGGLLSECAGLDYVRFTLCSVMGEAYVKLVPARHLPAMLANGNYIWEGTSLLGTGSDLFHDMTNVVGTGNVVMRPMPGTVHPLPWVTPGKYKVGAVLCETESASGDGQPNEADVRTLARRQLERLAARGYTLRSGTEVEFLLLRGDKVIEERAAYATASGAAAMEGFLYRVDELMQQCGVDIENLLQEYAAGQYELALAPRDGICGADTVFILRQALREIAAQHDMYPSFMSMAYDGVGTGMHFNHSLIDASGRNLFYDASQPDNFSALGRAWLGGVMRHLPALTALCCPTVNCYRRIGAPWAPNKANWGVDDRTATIRVRSKLERSTCLENRLPGGAGNLYIILAATVAAGLDGVERQLQCPPAVPLEACTDPLPATLEEAMAALQADDVMCEALGSKFIKWFLAEKTGSQLPVFPNWKKEDNSEKQFAKEREFYLKYI